LVLFAAIWRVKKRFFCAPPDTAKQEQTNATRPAVHRRPVAARPLLVPSIRVYPWLKTSGARAAEPLTCEKNFFTVNIPNREPKRLNFYAA
jgi:hypothetical protein